MKAFVLTVALILLPAGVLGQTGTIVGHVYTCLETCDRMAGAAVYLLSGDTVVRTVIADQRGNFVFLGVPSGHEYSLEARLGGFVPWRMRTWYLFAGQTQKVALPLDYTVLECTLGRQWRFDRPMEPPGVVRFRMDDTIGLLIVE